LIFQTPQLRGKNSLLEHKLGCGLEQFGKPLESPPLDLPASRVFKALLVQLGLVALQVLKVSRDPQDLYPMWQDLRGRLVLLGHKELLVLRGLKVF
jgi:hypothetical protein